MGAIIEVKYFNTFLLKRVGDTSNSNQGAYNGSFGVPGGGSSPLAGSYPQVPAANISNSTWAIEEARIRGGFNNTAVDYGA